MESSSEVKRSTQVITIQPNDTVLTAFPYEPHTSLLDFLKGEPKVLGAIQILLALITGGVGTIFAFNYINFSQKFPLVFLTGYPFWGALIYVITGYLTGINDKEKRLRRGVTAMNVISSLVAVAGITLTIISYRYQHKYCQMPSLEGICVIGRILFNGILSVLLIISIAELSIAVTIASFRSKCWTNSDEIVFFLPSDVTQDSELSAPEENAAIQFELQEQSSTDDSTTYKQRVFIGGYTFFKLRISRNPLAFQHSRKRGSNIYYTSSASVLDEPKNIPPPSQHHEEQTKLKSLSPTSEKKPTENTPYTEQLKDEDLKSAIAQPPRKQTQMVQSLAPPLQVFPSYSIKKLQVLPTKHLLSQALPVQAPTPYVTQPHGQTSEDMPYQDVSSQDTQSQDMISPYPPSQGITNQDLLSQVPGLPAQVMLFEAPTFHAAQSSNIKRLDQQSLQHQNQQFRQVAYQDMQSEVKLLTQEWKSKKEFHSRKSSKWQSLDWENKNCPSLKSHNLEQQNKVLQYPKQKSPDLQIQGQQSPKRKSLDEHIKDWLSPKRHSIDKQIQVKQDRQQHPDQQAEDLQVQEQLHQDGQFQIQEYQGWQFSGQQSQDWRVQSWRSKDWKVQEMQVDMPHSLKWDSQILQTQDLLEKESLKQTALQQEAQTVHAITRHQQLQSIPFQDSQYQGKNQQDLKSTDIQKEDMQIDTMQTRDNKPKNMKLESQDLYNLQSEDKKPDFNCSSREGSIQDTHFTSMSDINSEQDMQKNISICSTSYQDDTTLTSTSCSPKDQQQSEDSD
ncbi:PREDICTED: membrane-spanning 4-domains subfamily A member 14 [Odobenus rosmarus divergens]|uniref:Membrane-spanning 4-domains subfamily A member 14 n=1 Tax=Odobenus rosmarus divergens TaxID=9708 RepID=A0A9B0HF71_ODORO